MNNSKIIGLGSYVPENIVTNDDLAAIMETSNEWIIERTGIEERRHITKGDGNTTSTMGAKAARQAIKNANLEISDIDFIIFATLSPDFFFPGCGVQIQDLLDMPTIGALDIRNQCSGFIYGLSIADQYIKTGMYKNILVVASEYQSSVIDKTTRGRGVSVIFGDGAGAAVLTATDNNKEGILSTHLHSEGKFAKELYVNAPSVLHWVDELLEEKNPTAHLPVMNGQLVFKNAVVRFSEVINEGLEKNNLTKDDIDLLIPHQANLRISQFIQRRFKLDDDKVFNNIQKYGDTTVASIAIALKEAVEEDRLKKGDLLVLAAFGSGFTWGSVIIRW